MLRGGAAINDNIINVDLYQLDDLDKLDHLLLDDKFDKFLNINQLNDIFDEFHNLLHEYEHLVDLHHHHGPGDHDIVVHKHDIYIYEHLHLVSEHDHYGAAEHDHE